MTQCEHFISSYSTFSWWGAWLGSTNPKRVVVYPKEAIFRPGYGKKAEGVCCDSWIELQSLRGFWDDYRLVSRLEKRLPKFIVNFFY